MSSVVRSAATILRDLPGSHSREDREVRRLTERAELRNYLIAATTGNHITGAEAELRAAVLGDDARASLVPWEALLPRGGEQGGQEHRVDSVTSTPSDVGATQAGILGRVFIDTAAAYLGVDMPSVPIGDRNYPVLTAGVTPVMKAKSAVQDAEAATIDATVLEPVRLTARYTFNIESTNQLAGMEEALRADLAGAFGEAMDNQILNGNGTAPQPSGFFNKLTAPSNPTAISTFANMVKELGESVDGRYAWNLTGVHLLVGTNTYALATTLTNPNGDVFASDYLIQRSGGFMAHALIPAPASTIQNAIIYKAARGAGSAVAPVWSGFDIIRDPYTGAAKGEVAITAIMQWNFAVLRSDAYRYARFKVA